MDIKFNENILETDGEKEKVIFSEKRIYQARMESNGIWYAHDDFGVEQSISKGEDIIAGSFFKDTLEIVKP